jgi:hypothetical protein
VMRPAKPDREPPEGCEFVAAKEGPDWEAVNSVSHGCRWMEGGKSCGTTPTVARLDRAHSGSLPRWFYYCSEHLYGRWIEDGQVMSWIVREIARAGEPEGRTR